MNLPLWILLVSLSSIIVVATEFYENCPASGYLYCPNGTPAPPLLTSSTLNIRNCIFENCPSIACQDTSVYLSNVTFRGGGPMSISLSLGNVSLSNVNYENITSAVGDGGCLSITSSTRLAFISLNGVKFRNCRANGGYGGALLFRGNAYLFRCAYCSFVGCHAANGGAFAFLPDAFPLVQTLDSCYFEANSADLYGGAIYDMASKLQVRNSIFIGCSANTGGAISVQTTISAISEVIDNCTFIGNSAGGYGGAIDMISGQVTISNSYFANNHASRGGGISNEYGLACFFTNCLFSNNSALLFGGGLYSVASNPFIVSNSNFTGNYASRGGSLFLDSTNRFIIIYDCMMWSNKATLGGSIYTTNCLVALFNSSLSLNSASLGGALHSVGQSSIQIQYCQFTRNTADTFGGSLFLTGLIAFILDSSVFENSFAGFGGGAVYITDSANIVAFISSCIFQGNIAFNQGGALQLGYQVSLSLTDGSFINNRASFGGAVYLFGPTSGNSEMEQVTLVNNSASNAGGSIYITDNFNLLVYNTQIQGSYSGTLGGFLFLKANARGYFVNCQVSNSSAHDLGGTFYLEWNSLLYIFQSVFEDSTSGFTSSFCHLAYKSSIFIDDGVSIYYQGGGLVNYTINTMFNFENDCTFTLNSLFLDSYTPSRLVINEALLKFTQNCNGTMSNFRLGPNLVLEINAEVGSFASLDYGSQLYLSETTFDASIHQIVGGMYFFLVTGTSELQLDAFTLNALNSSGTVWPASYLIFASDSCSISISGQSVLNGFKGINLVSIEQQSFFSCSGGPLITQSLVSDCLLQIKEQSTASLGSYCEISQNTCQSGISGLSLSIAGQTKIGTICLGAASNLLINDNSVINGNVADYGGAVLLKGVASQMSIQGNNISITENMARYAGGAFYVSSSAGISHITPGSSYLNITGNAVDPTTSLFPSSLALFGALGGNGFLCLDDANNARNGNLLSGTIYLQNLPLLSDSVLNVSKSYQSFNAVKWQSNVATVRLANPIISYGQGIPLSGFLPDIVVQALDAFGNPSHVGMFLDPITVKLSLLFNGSTFEQLRGETVKTIVNESSDATVTFSQLSLANSTAGTFTLVAQLQSKLSQTIILSNITFASCSDNSRERIVGSLCFSVFRINLGIVQIFSTLSLVPLIACCLSTLYLHRFRQHSLIRVNSRVFLATCLFGSSLAFLSIALQWASIASNVNYCLMTIWLENIAFTIVITSLILKLYRILQVFYQDQGTGKRKRSLTGSSEPRRKLSDPVLLYYLLGAVVLTIIYLVFWSILDLPQPSEQVSETNHAVLQDYCGFSSSSFSLATLLLKLLVTIIASYLCYANRNVPSTFNETKAIGFVCYNFVIFTILAGTVADFLISEANLSFAIRAMGIILSHGFHVSFLIARKILACINENESELFVPSPLSKTIKEEKQKKKPISPIKKNMTIEQPILLQSSID